MRFPILALACVLAATTGTAVAQTAASATSPRPPTPVPLTLPEALRQAESAHPAVRAREAQLAAAEGARREASSLLAHNPELSTERTRRRAAGVDGRTTEWGLGISQSFEIGGQQARRREAAEATLEALRAEIEDARRQARADAAQRFHAVLAAQRRVAFEQRSLDLFESTAQAVARRRAAGEDTRLDANLALIEAERGRNALGQARERLLDARGDLALALRVAPDALPEVVGELPLPSAEAPAPYTLAQLSDSATRLPLQRALAAREQAARARAGLERAGRLPDVTVGLSVAREGPGDARERATTLTLSVPLPLFKRNEAAIGQALADATQAEIERATGMREALAQVERLWSRLASQRERVLRLQRALLAPAADNQQLAVRSRQAGQIGLLDLLLVNRQALDAERDLEDALAEFHATRIELELAAGWPQQGASQ